MGFAAVHQFHSGTAVGDAITDQMLALQRRLRALGYISDIYAEHIDTALADRIRPVQSLPDTPATLLIVHHSIGHTAFEQIEALTMPIATVFHSITPAAFFDDELLRQRIREGFEQLRSLARCSRFGIADSNHNRRQMYDAGFVDVEVLPVKTDFTDARAARAGRDHTSDEWLFVGRVVPNKRQLQLVEAFSRYRSAYGSGHLHIVGDTSYSPYVEQVRSTIQRLGLASLVTMHGKVPTEALQHRYRCAGLFTCLSEHEGFGVPLLEAMAAGVPVIARSAAAVPETMGGAGVLLDDDDPFSLAAVARLLSTDTELRSHVVATQDARLAKIEQFDVDGLLQRVLRRTDASQRPVHVQVQGPFETSYSLAILNRELALHLDRRPGMEVTIHATEGPGDYQPAASDLARQEPAAKLFRAGLVRPYPDVAIRQMFPPRVHDTDAGLTFQYFGWEESGIPDDYVADFNRYLDGIGTMSTFVKDILRAAGVTIPIEVVGVGVHAPDPEATIEAPELADVRSTRLVHISSAFPRKGVDVLLTAYFEAFTGQDDVSLVLKTFPNPHNQVVEQLEALRAAHPNPPHVCWIDRDLDRSEIDALYGLATAYVHPARGEGFGLPVAEAMLASVPVISVAATGLADFVSEQTATVIGHTVALADTHLSTPGSTWMEPDRGDLVQALRAVHCGDGADARRERVARARELIDTEYSWDRVAERWSGLIATVRRRQRGLTVAAVTTYNSRCGIAEYSASLFEPYVTGSRVHLLADVGVTPTHRASEGYVRRVWPNYRSGRLDDLVGALDAVDADVTHIQYNMGFYSIPQLGELIRTAVSTRPTVVTLHRTAPLDEDWGKESLADITDELRSCSALIVHQRLDRDRLAQYGVAENVHVIPIGTDPPLDIDRIEARVTHRVPAHEYVIGAYGFLLPHKGLLTLIDSVAMLRSRDVPAFLVAACAIHPDVRSAAHLVEVRRRVDELDLGDHVHLVTEYLPHDESLSLLATSDVIVLPYEHTNESSSAALRSVLPLGRPIITSDIGIFDDVRDAVMQLPAPVQAPPLTHALERLWIYPDEARRLADRARTFTIEHSWPAITCRTTEVYEVARTAWRGRRADAPERSDATTSSR